MGQLSPERLEALMPWFYLLGVAVVADIVALVVLVRVLLKRP
jgi:hypothetical protein